MKILIAPDKFKSSLNAREVAENIAKGLRDVFLGATIDIVPMADGGEGTAEVISNALGGSWLECRAHDPLGREIEARYGWIENHPPSPELRRDGRKLAVMEMSMRLCVDCDMACCTSACTARFGIRRARTSSEAVMA